jgi:hypothetical protein
MTDPPTPAEVLSAVLSRAHGTHLTAFPNSCHDCGRVMSEEAFDGGAGAEEWRLCLQEELVRAIEAWAETDELPSPAWVSKRVRLLCTDCLAGYPPVPEERSA